MPNRNKLCLLLGLIAVIGCGCASSGAQSYWLTAADLPQDAHGGWITVRHGIDATGRPRTSAGEFIAISGDSLYLAATRLEVIPLRDAHSARLVNYEPNAGMVGGLAALGTISTISHGFYLIVTAPMWILGGCITTNMRQNESLLNYPKHGWAEFLPFTRYPQGLPPDMDRDLIRARPPHKKADKSNEG